jgi:hypothetical protein
MRTTAIFLFFFLLYSHLPGQAFHVIDPSDTGTGISNEFGTHWVMRDMDISSKNRLFIFFPGTGGAPVFYREIIRTAAELGYHSIGLAYPNALAINSLDVCALSLDGDCHGNARREILDGIDLHPSINVDTANAIQNRLEKLLIYLQEIQPDALWDQFLENGTIRWDLARLAGHSQGGGHAGFIASIHEVDRSIMIASMDWVSIRQEPAAWMQENTATPASRYYGFIHRLDEAVNSDNAQITWKALNMDAYGDVLLADTILQDLEEYQVMSHSFLTDLPPVFDTSNYHGAPVVDVYTPRGEKGEFLLKPVWKFLIDSPEQIVHIEQKYSSTFGLNIYPNPASEFFYVERDGEIIDNAEFILYDEAGRVMLNLPMNKARIAIDALNIGNGSYTAVLKSGQRVMVGRVIVQR